MKTETITPRIYVACLAAYNNGELHGAWIDADQDADAIREEIAVILTTSPEPNAEEWAIHDYEGFGDHKLATGAGCGYGCCATSAGADC